ncbi:response regulator [Oceanicella actignis]|uniref:Two-component system, chemotaxis family, response regulator CheY n=1 Tax=Oceanicella actignis TaxID=1189325 RepID=A0A1M7T5E4_9RHOB|nr:response regulator [Oceanicella actignis]TYO84875.1 two-component system chemotaxis response regulator CheY [Oceanicella actignis]SET43139.1 two-component system, chemotaxis family, response regulator CheY [Oceanicella actignis]SHN65934.1 two-component system, chemotaxis family, response regulator CheY [Oceanicella actignis]
MPAAKTLKVLVVDDQQTMRGLARQCLKKLGVIDVSLAASGDAALQMMGSKMFDIVISDLNMPGLSGVELAQKIKAHPVFNRIPVFLATSDAYRDQAVEGVVDHFVAKPFSVADMREAMEAHLGPLT